MNLACDLELDHADGLRFRFTVHNAGDEPTEIQFRDGQTADFAVYEDGSEHWRWSDGRLFTQALHSQPLDPDEVVAYEGHWNHPECGEYTAISTLEAVNYDCRVERDCVITDEDSSSNRP